MSTVAAETTAPLAQASNTGFVAGLESITDAPVGSVVATLAFARAVGRQPIVAAGRPARSSR
ncbi:MAG TPA: hypothetical protein VFZ21_22265 [Gemmatimonadaceae bacterium]|jgi:hypothetical protein|nr:hypothetical protein [Gemmatimonadaceae bacterium]